MDCQSFTTYYKLANTDIGLIAFGSDYAFEAIISFGQVALQIGFLIPVLMVCHSLVYFSPAALYNSHKIAKAKLFKSSLAPLAWSACPSCSKIFQSWVIWLRY